MNPQGSRRSGRRKGRGPRGSRTRTEQHRSETPVKQSFWQKLIAFFRPKAKSASSNGAATTKNYPPYPGKTGERPVPAPTQSRPSRKPEAVDVTSPKLYVGNLSFDASESDLFELFNGVGTVRNAEIVTHRDSDKSKGFAFVTMNTLEEAKRAVTELHDKDFLGRKLVVSGAKTPVDRSAAA